MLVLEDSGANSMITNRLNTIAKLLQKEYTN